MTKQKGWKREAWSQETEQRAGWLANHVNYDNAHKVRCHKNYNGSGPTVFGGAKSWPVLTVEVSFEVGQEALRDQMAERMKALIDEILPDV